MRTSSSARCPPRTSSNFTSPATAYPTHLFDDHRGPVPDVVWSLYRTAIDHLGETPTLVEWDKDVPDLDTVIAEARIARTIATSVRDDAGGARVHRDLDARRSAVIGAP
ncbi:MAG: DUF692 family multinuclear iron-containing protein [Kofleriaceae bacterium]